MHPILSKASLREPDTERLNTMLRVALTPLQYETVVAVYLHGHPQKEVAIDRGVSRQACASCCSGPNAAWDGIWGTYNLSES